MNKTPAIINTEKETRSFFWFLTLVLVGLSVWVIYFQSNLQQTRYLIPFCSLMSIHILLHWLLRKFAEKPGWILKYILSQGIIMVSIIFLTRDIGMTLGLSMALIGEAIGVYGISKRGFISSVFYLVLSLGSYIWLAGLEQIGVWLISLFPMILFVVIYVEMYSRQANANELAQQLLTELEAANRQLKEYSAQVEDLTIAAERQRLARELHDTLSQGLAGLILQLEAIDANLSNNRTGKARQIILQTMDTARSTLAEARLAIDDLRQNQQPDCREALQQIANDFSKQTGIPCKTEINLPQNLDVAINNAIIRMVTEAFSNIARHARATQVSLVAFTSAMEILLEISDNGKGFEPAAVPALGHYGLIGMQERAKLVNGSLEMDSHPGAGTTVRIRIPLK